MADASVTFLLDNVKQLLVYHYNLVSGAENELKQLQNELEEMKSFLKDASQNHKKEELFKEWERQIREVVYEAEDTIDSCVTHASVENGRNFLHRNLNKKRIDLAKMVQSLRENRVKPVFEKVRSHIGNMAAGATTSDKPNDKPRKAPSPRQENVVGFEDETDTLIKYLIEELDEVEVISIIGMPGLGKTTVAWKIYRDPRIQYEFPTLIWVYVSQEFNKKDVFLTILRKFTQQDFSSKTEEELAQTVRDYLSRGKFLLFIDDVWSTDTWDEIKAVLPKDNGASKVLITSRDEKVAWHANRRRDPHKLRFLNEKESWELLQLEVFGKLDDFPPELEILGRQIAEQCDGLPLAIIVIGGILVEKFSTTGGIVGLKNEWKKVSDSVKTYLIYDDKQKRMENIIALSYTKLPYELRDCFLYLGMFPEDFEIPAWKLIQLWIAEGFIQQQPGKSLEEIAQDNLKDLITRNLIMVEKTKPNGDVKTCRVHDMIREFCQNQVVLEKLNLFQEIRMSKHGVFEPHFTELQKYRRLCIHSYVEDFILKKQKVPNARTFLCFSKSPVVLENKDISYFNDAFNLLRVLEASTIKFPKFPAKLTNLVHLRYVTLSGDEFKIIPEVISDLWNVQTLIVDTMQRTLEIRADIWKMLQLRHLKTKASIVLKKEGKGQGGENLQTLTRLSPESCTEDVFNKAKNLKTLGVRGKLSTLLDAKCFEKLGRLEKLKLVNDVHPKVASENPLHRLPDPNRLPQKLRVLVLSATFLDWMHMSTLGKLVALEELKLKDNAFKGDSLEVVGGDFRNLEVLHIARSELKFWKASVDAFPKLRSLILKNCEKLEGVPFSLEKNLEILYMERVTRFAVASARKIEQARKEKLQGKYRSRTGGFKLLIAPGDE